MNHIYQNIHGWFDFDDLYSQAINHFPDGSRFVEIGVWQGKSLSYLVIEAINNDKKFIIDAIDNWKGSTVQIQKGHESYQPITETEGALFKQFLENIDSIKQYINIIQKPSAEAVTLYENNSLDFIFIDADHEMPYILEDLRSWFPKLKKGGWYAGHDAGHPPVAYALDIFCKENNLSWEQKRTSWLIKT
jgi:hypothetical protein